VGLTRISVALIAFALALGACNAFRSTDECSVATDCPRGSRCAEGGGYCRTSGPIQLGAVLPLSGSQQGRGATRLDGLRFGAWLVDRDPAHKILGRGLELHARDTASAAENVKRLTTELIGMNVAVFFGPMNSPEVLDAQTLTRPKQILHIGPGVGAATLGEAQGSLPGRFLFQLSTDIRNGTIRGLPLFFIDAKRPANYASCLDGIALVVNEDATGLNYESALSDLFPNNCIPVTAKVRVPRDKKASYDDELKTLLDAKNEAGEPTQCLFFSIFPPVVGEIMRGLAAKKQPSRPAYDAFLGSSVVHDPNIFDEAKSGVAGAPSLAENMHGVDFDPNPPRAGYRDLEALWEEYVQTRPDLEGRPMIADHANWAEATITAGLALELAGRADDPVALRDAYLSLMQPGPSDVVFGPKEIGATISRIRDARKDGRQVELDYRGAISDFDFDDRGFVDTHTYVYRAKSGQFERVVGYSPDELKRSWESPGPACKR
jgi:hypothetical protein